MKSRAKWSQHSEMTGWHQPKEFPESEVQNTVFGSWKKKIVLHKEKEEDLVWCSSSEKFLSVLVPVGSLYQSVSQ